MRDLNGRERAEIAAYDLRNRPEFLKVRAHATLAEVFAGLMETDLYAARHWMRRTRFYNYLTVAGKDVGVRTVAVKCDRAGGQMVKEVLRARVGSAAMYGRDLAYRNMSGYVVDWSPEGCGRRCGRNLGYEGQWGGLVYSRRGAWRIDCPVVNPEALALSERFKWCAWRPECGDVLGYLKLYAEHPRIEMLVKIGLPEFAAMPGLVRQLEGDRGFLRYVSKSAGAIKEGRFGADVVRKAFRLGVDFSRAAAMIAARRRFHGELLRTVDAEKALAYIAGQRGMSDWEYCEYLRLCAELGQDLRDTKVAFPKRGHARMKTVRDLIENRNRRKSEADLKRTEEELARIVEPLSGVEKAWGPYAVRFPKKNKDFVREGTRLHHCVHKMGYLSKMARGDCVIAFVRLAGKPAVPFVTVELSASANKVVQCYGKNNSKPDRRVLDFVEGKLIKLVSGCMKKAERKSA